MTTSFVCSLLLLAQDAEPAGGGLDWRPILTLWLPIGLLFYFLLIRPQRKQHSQRETMLQGLKKNDRVITAGGIHGVVTNVHREADAQVTEPSVRAGWIPS